MDLLKLYRGDHLVTQVVLGERPLELGRATGCDLVVDDPDLADRHLIAVRQRGTVVTYDVSRGTRTEPRALAFGEALALGREHRLVRTDDGPVAPPRAGLARDTETLRAERRQGSGLLLLIGRGTEARRLRIAERPVHVGRAAENDLVLCDRAASARHCRLEPSGEGLVVRDLGSSNGTFVNGARVERAIVGPGAVLCVGRTELHVLAKDAKGRIAGTELVAESAPMLGALAAAQRAASLPWPALLLGESGSGKEGLARLLHTASPRAARPLVTLNAGGVPRDLVESELFGHERGAFTGASTTRRGVFEQAEGGTLFLDEIGELPLGLQARLLRVLESGEVRRVGAESARRVDVRVVCATHRDLRAMVDEGTFRQDLYFRIARVVIEVPPLRERLEDLEALCAHFLAELEPLLGSRVLSPEALACLRRYAWPGNVRELRNVVSAAAVASTEAAIAVAEIEAALSRLGGASNLRAQPSPESLRLTVAQHGGNLTAAARALGMARTTLRDRLRASEPEGEAG